MVSEVLISRQEKGRELDIKEMFWIMEKIPEVHKKYKDFIWRRKLLKKKPRDNGRGT